MSKASEAFRTISEVADDLDVPKHVLRFWEVKFPQIRPMKRGGGRRYYRPEDMELLRGIRQLLHAAGYTIKGVQKILREQGVDSVKRHGRVEEIEKSPEQGKKARAVAAGEGRPANAGKSANAMASAMVGKSKRHGPYDAIRTAIAELEMCRKLLLGEAHVPPATQRSPRAARS